MTRQGVCVTKMYLKSPKLLIRAQCSQRRPPSTTDEVSNIVHRVLSSNVAPLRIEP